MQKIYAYIRVSTDQQDLDNQRHGVIEYAKKHSLNPIEFFEDTASGKKDWKLRDIGKLIDSSSEQDIILVSEISRLARSTLQVLEILKICADKNLSVHIVKNNMIMDDSLHSTITATILGLAAEIEREFISARTTEALARRKALGLPLGRPKGSTNKTKKLDGHKAEIKEYLGKGVHKTSICRMYDCSPQTLYTWMEQNNLSKFIKPKPKSKPKNGLKFLK